MHTWRCLNRGLWEGEERKRSPSPGFGPRAGSTLPAEKAKSKGEQPHGHLGTDLPLGHLSCRPRGRRVCFDLPWSPRMIGRTQKLFLAAEVPGVGSLQCGYQAGSRRGSDAQRSSAQATEGATTLHPGRQRAPPWGPERATSGPGTKL